MQKVILLNGISSAGKSTLARAIQTIAKRPMLHVAMDAFLEMMPPRYANHEHAFHFIERRDGRVREIEITTGPYGTKLMKTMRLSIAAMAGQGFSVIVDDVILGGEIDHYRSVLSAFDLRCVKVDCPLDIAEAREATRGDRMLGLARWQYPRVHQGINYDLIVDTSAHSATECAESITAAFDL